MSWDNEDRQDVTQQQVFDSLRVKLRDALNLVDSTCFLTIHPEAIPIPPSTEFVSISPGNSAFNDAHQIGGGRNQLTEEMQVRVTAYARIHLDKVGQDEQLFHDANRGLAHLKARILSVLVGADLELPTGKPFLRYLLQASSCSAGDHDKEKALGWITLSFGVSWDWSL